MDALHKYNLEKFQSQKLLLSGPVMVNCNVRMGQFEKNYFYVLISY